MSRVAPKTGEDVGPTKRRAMTPARMRRCHEYHDGICEECGAPVAMYGKTVRYDHRIPVWMHGDDDDGPNLRPIHRDPCDIMKFKVDAADIGKVKRLRGETGAGPKRPIQSPGFKKPATKKPWPKRKMR